MKAVTSCLWLAVSVLLAVALPLAAQDTTGAQQSAPRVLDSQRVNFYRRIENSVQARLGQFEYRPYKETARLENFDLRWLQLGFLPFVRAWGRTIYPASVPAPEEIGVETAAFATPGEIAPLSFCIRTLDGAVSGLQLAAGALVSLDSDDFIPPDSVEIGVVEYFPVRWGQGSSSRDWRWHPVRIWPLSSFPGNRYFTREPPGTFKVPPNTTIQFWLRIHTPRRLHPGAYTGSIQLDHWGGSYRQTLTFTVLAPSLQSEGLPPFGAFIPGPLDSFACADLAAHGIRSVARWYDPQELPLLGGEGGPVADFRLEDLFMRRLLEAGIDGPQIIYACGAGGAAFDSALAAVAPDSTTSGPVAPSLLYARTVQAIDKHATASGWPRLVWGIIDRVGDWGKSNESYLALSRALGRVMGYRANLVSPLLGENGGRIVNDLKGSVSVWMVGDEVEADDTMSREAVWGYTALTQRDSAGAARERIGFASWRARRDGMFVWAYNWSGGGSSWNDFDSSRMDWMLSYRNLDDTFLPTPAWEGIREGIVDRRYLRTLNRMINAAPVGSETAVAALRFLETIRQPGYDWSQAETLIPPSAPQTSDNTGAGTLRRAIAGFMVQLAAEGQFPDPGR